MSIQTAPRIGSSRRIFAEFVVCRSWHDVSIQIQRLEGAQYLGFTSDRRDARLQFSYRDQKFFIQEEGAVLLFQVNDSTCPERILWEVQSHFAALLSPDLND